MTREEAINIQPTMLDSRLIDLAKRSEAGDLAAREQLILDHLWLIERSIVPYLNKGVPREDLYQEACYGLILAVDKYDWRKDVQLSTYASFHIKKYLRQAILNQNHIRLPEHISYMILRFHNKYLELRSETDNEPSISEISEALNISEQRMKTILSYAFSVVPLEGSCTPFETTSSNDQFLVSNEKALQNPSAEDTFFDENQEVLFNAFAPILTSKENTVISMRFGLKTNGVPSTFPEIASHLNTYEENARRIYKAAMEKIIQKVRSDTSEILGI